MGKWADGAARVEEARQRSAMTVGGRRRLTPGDAAQIAKVSSTAILRAWRAGDLRGEGQREGCNATFDEADVRAWARRKRFIA